MSDNYRSNMPCDNLDKYPIAKEIVKHFQKLMPFHSRGRAIEEVIGRLNDGETAEAMQIAATTYAQWGKKVGKDAQYLLSAGTFYALGGEWERFSEGVMPDVPKVGNGKRDPGESAARLAEEERRQNNQRYLDRHAQPGTKPKLLREIQEELRQRQGGSA